MPYLAAVLYELLRLYPPVSQLINRVTTDRAVLGGRIVLPKRTWVGWNAYGAHVDPANWGTTAGTFDPARWGSDVEKMKAKVRKDCVDGRYIPFNAHSRKCLGQGFALLEMKTVLFELVRRTKWTIDPSYKLKLTSVSYVAPHLLCIY
jgi:xanthocillin biosynthesis cytochrome P450 monooxygenase